jgi:Fe-only nitrogenase accessory protein AnfO
MCISEIAVLIAADGRTSSFEEGGSIVVFQRTGGTWHQERIFPFALGTDTNLRELRGKVSKLISFLGTCRTMVAKSASGAIFFELEKAHISVFEIQGAPLKFLDLVWHDISLEREAEPPKAADRVPAPLETEPGKFTISIREIQAKHPEMSSKQVLRQFIHRGEFTELRILCDHPPPWIEVEAVSLGIEIEISTDAEGEVRMVLTRVPVRECC